MEIKNKLAIYSVVFILTLLFLFLVKGESNISESNADEISEVSEVSLVPIDDVTQENFEVISNDSTQTIENIENEENLSENEGILLNESFNEELENELNIIKEQEISSKKIDLSKELNILSDENNNSQDNVSVLNKSLEINVLSYPQGNTSSYNVGFSFKINNSNIERHNCSFYLNNQTSNVFTSNYDNLSMIVINPTLYNVAKTIYNDSFSWTFECYDSLNASLNDSKSGNFSSFIDLSPKISFWADKYNISVGEKVNIRFNAILTNHSKAIIVVNYSDGQSSSFKNSPVDSNAHDAIFNPSFSNPGTYNLGLTLTLLSNGEDYYRNISLVVTGNASSNSSSSSTTQTKDNEKPKIDLISPSNGAKISYNKIDFLFTPSDNVKLSNCTFSLYYYNGSQYIASLAYKQIINNPSNNQTINITLKEFDNGDYSWDAECVDNSSNLRSTGRDFYFDSDLNTSEVVYVGSLKTSSNYASESDEIEKLISLINDFLVNEEKYEKEPKEVVEYLGLLEKARTHKKRLLQLKSDLNDNLGYARSSSEKEDRLIAIREELDSIKKDCVFSVKVDKFETYSKNSISAELSDMIKLYLSKNNIFMSAKETDNLVKSIKEKQGDLNLENHIKWVEFEYLDGSFKKYSLVYKKILKNEGFEGIIESIPKSVAESVKGVEFTQDYSVIEQDPIVFFDTDVLDGSISYLIESYINFDDLKNIDSVGFALSSTSTTSKNSITGYSILLFPENRGFWFYFSWILVLLVIIIIIYNYLIMRRVRRLRKDVNYNKLKECLKNAKNALDDKNTPKAKEIYSELKVLYSDSSEEIKLHFYDELVKLQSLIDRKEISSLIRECIEAINAKRIGDAALLYSKIKPIYKRLPEDLRIRVYEKIIPYIK